MPLFDRAQAADYFALGCTIAEIYSRSPLFSQRSIVDYLLAFVDATPSPSSSPTGPDHLAQGGDGWITDVATSMLGSSRPAPSESSPWNASILLKLSGLPYNIKVRELCLLKSKRVSLLTPFWYVVACMQHAVLALIYPHPSERLLLVGALDGDEVLSTLRSSRKQLAAPATLPLDDYTPPSSPIFPAAFKLLDQYFAQLHRFRDWGHQFSTTRAFLSALTPINAQSPNASSSPAQPTLAPLHWGLLEPVLSRFFSLSMSSSLPSLTTNGNEGGKNAGADQGGVDRVVAAIVFLLPALARAGVVGPGGISPSIIRLDDVVRVYESAELGFVLKTCLVAPDVLRSLFDVFGAAAFVDQVLPVVVEWLSAGSGAQESGSSSVTSSTRHVQPLFALEACSLAAVSYGELAAPSLLGASLTIKYAVPKLLRALGKVKVKWNKLAGSSTVRRRDPTASVEADGMHMTMMNKLSLYEPHHVADALLQLCREIGDFCLVSLLLPHLFDVLPRLVQLSEAIGAIRIEGVPVRPRIYDDVTDIW
jgi:hypothetical protein